MPSLQTLCQRSVILKSLRQTLDSMGFVEVETPVRIAAPANELHIDMPASEGMFLRASPELQMKRLLCQGAEKIYQIGACFRAGEKGERHNPEFTMLEWYRAHAGYEDVLRDMETMTRNAAIAIHGTARWIFNGIEVDAGDTPWQSLTVQEAYREFAGWDPVENYDAERFDMDMAFKIEPHLPKDRPCVLKDYPIEAAALSRPSPRDPRVAERWEAYIGGMELCNAFGELTDAKEQRRRFEETARRRKDMGRIAYPLDEDFLRALDNGLMPPSGGAALGVDRLCMVLLNLPTIADVRNV